VEVEAAYYSAPPGWIGRRVQVQWNASHIRLIDPRSGQLLREHFRQQRGRHRIQDKDRPPRTPLATHQLLRRAEITGPHVGALCQAMHRTQGQMAAPHSGCALAREEGLMAAFSLIPIAELGVLRETCIHLSGGQGSAGTQPERRLKRRNGVGQADLPHPLLSILAAKR